MFHEEMCFFKLPKNAFKTSGWGYIYGKKIYTTDTTPCVEHSLSQTFIRYPTNSTQRGWTVICST